jgi:hypothetical protein
MMMTPTEEIQGQIQTIEVSVLGRLQGIEAAMAEFTVLPGQKPPALFAAVKAIRQHSEMLQDDMDLISDLQVELAGLDIH